MSGLSLSGCANEHVAVYSPVKAKALGTVRIGVVGVGNRGPYLTKKLAGMQGAEVRAVCDIIPEKAERVQKQI